MAARLRRDGRSGCSARWTAQAISGRVTSWIASSERWSMSPRPRRSMASTPADRATAAVPSGTVARPKTSSTSTSSKAGHRDRAERVALFYRRLAALEHLEQRQETGDRLEAAADSGEDLFEFERSEHQTVAQETDLVLHRVRDRHRQRLGIAEPFEHRPEGCGQPFGGDPEPLDGDHLSRDEPEEASRALDCRLGEKGFGGGLEEAVLGESPARVSRLLVLRLDDGGVLVGQHRRRLEGDQPGEQRQGVRDGAEVALTLGGLECAPCLLDDRAHRQLGQIEVAPVCSGNEFLEGPVEPRGVHGDRGGARFLPLHRYMVRTPGLPRSPRAPSSRSSAARINAASVVLPDMSRAISLTRSSSVTAAAVA